MLELLLLINHSRVSLLKTDHELTIIAEKRADYLCNHEFSHDRWTEFKSNFAWRGENLYRGNEDMKSVNERFFNSPKHREIMLNNKYQYIGLGTRCDILVEEFGGN